MTSNSNSELHNTLRFDDIINFLDQNLDTHVQGFYHSEIIEYVKRNIDWIHSIGLWQME